MRYADIELVEKTNILGFFNDGYKTVYYDIVLDGSNIVVGKIDLRIGMNDYLYYLGQVGYFINEEYRGHNYSYKACKVLFDIAKQKYRMSDLIITCSPDNIASFKTLKKLNCQLIETVDVPQNHKLYWRHERVKCIFKVEL